MPLAATPDGSDGSGATTPSPSPSAVAGDEEEASNGQGRTGDDGGVQAIGAQGREGALDAETLVGEFPEWNWGGAVQLRARLPLLLFLKHCDRGNATTSADANAMLHRVKLWLQGHERFKTLRFESSPERIFSYLFTIAKNKLLADMFGVRHRQEEEKDVFDLVVYPWRACVANVFASVPLGWTVMCDEEEGLLFSTISKGANVKVGIRKADISGRSKVSFVTFNGRNVKDEHAQDWPSHIDSGNRNQRQLLEKVGSLQPCVGTSREHLDGNAARGFLSVVHTAEISLEEKGGVFSEGGLGWTSAVVKGCLETSGGVSGILGWVGGRRVFWSKECTGVAASGDGGLDGRCSPCRGFHRDVFLGLATAGAGEDPLLGGAAGGSGLGGAEGATEEPEPEPQAQPALEKKRVATPNLVEQQIKNARWQCFVADHDVQGQALLDFLLYSGTRDVFLKYPKGSLPRALYEALVRWNTTGYPPPKVFIFHPEILRLACCAPGFAGSHVYDALREVLHLPSMARVVQLRRGIRGATGIGSGMQMVDIKRYAQMAATEGVDNADLVGVVTWDLVRLNRNGFRANPNGTGISGLVDANSFFNPECGAPPLDGGGSVHGDDSEDILDRVFTTRYMEARFVSAGNPKYNFIAYRGAVVSLNADYIQRMLTTVLRALASPHEDVVFDVIAAVCGGDVENMVCSRYFQLHGGTETFEHRDGDADYDYSGLSVAFRHPHHLHEVFNMTDPARVVQKVVEALVESGNSQRERSLGMYRTDWNTGRSEFREFSSKTAQNLRSYGAELAASADTAVPAVPAAAAAAAVGGTTGASRRPAPAAVTATATAAAPVGGNTGASARLASAATTVAAAAPVSGTTGASERLGSVATTATAASVGGTTGTSERLGSDPTTTTAAAAASVDGATGASERLAPSAATTDAATDAATAATTAPVGGTTGASERLGTVATSTTAAAAASVSGTTGAPDRVTSAATTASAAAATAAAPVDGTAVAPERRTSGATTVTTTATAVVGVSTAAPERLASAATTAAAAPVRTASVSEWIASIAAEAAAAAATAAPVGGTAGASERLGSAAATAIADAAAATTAVPVAGTTAATAAVPVAGTTAATAAPVGGTSGASERLGSAAATAIAADAAAATAAVPVTGTTAATAAPVGGTSGASERLGSATATATADTAAATVAVPVAGTTTATAAPLSGTAGASERLGSAAATAIADAAVATAAVPVTGTTGPSERSTPRLPMPARGVCHARVKGPRQFAQQMVSKTVIRTVQSQRETLSERLGCLENFEKMASHLRDLIDIFNGNYGRSDSERRQGVNKIKGYVTSSDSALIRRLMEILDFFSKWEYELASSPPNDTTNWQRHFISQASWFDLRMCILGFVSLCRYVFPAGAAGSGDADQREGASRARRRYVNPRTFSQGFAHPDGGGPGTHGPRNQEIERFKRSKYGEGTHRILTQRQQTFLTSKLGNLNRTPGAMPRVAAERRSRNAARRESGSGPDVAASSVAQ